MAQGQLLGAHNAPTAKEELRNARRKTRLAMQAEHPARLLPDLGVQLTAQEEAYLRAYALGLGVDYNEVVEYYADGFHVLPPSELGPEASELASHGFIPVDELAFLMKNHIYQYHWKIKDLASHH